MEVQVNMTKKNSAYFFWAIITVVPIAGLVWSVLSPRDFESWQSVSRAWFSGFGVLGPIVFVFIQALQVVFTPISHYTVGAIGGYLYGPYVGGALNYVGRIIGHLSAFAISRKFGRSYMEKHLDQETITKYDRIVGGNQGKAGDGSLQALVLFFNIFSATLSR